MVFDLGTMDFSSDFVFWDRLVHCTLLSHTHSDLCGSWELPVVTSCHMSKLWLKWHQALTGEQKPPDCE